MKLLLGLVLSGGLMALDLPRWNHLEVSQVALATGATLDLISSRSGYETQALYRSPAGRCEEKCWVIRLGIVGGAILLQRTVARKVGRTHPAIKVLTAVNYGAAASSTVVAAHNWKLQRYHKYSN